MGILNIAASGLNAFQRALETTGNNVVNVNNESYSHQTIIFAATPSKHFAGSFIGSGVTVSNIRRNSDTFATTQVRESLTNKTQYDSFLEQASQVDKLLSQNGASVSFSMQNFFNSLSSLIPIADSLATRGVVLGQSELLVNQFNTLQLRLDEYQQKTTGQLAEAVNQVNQISANIAAVNLQLTTSPTSPELQDQRDEMLRQLSQYVDVTVIPDGQTINVSIGNGQMLVMGTQIRELGVNVTSTGEFGTQVVIGNGAGVIDITDTLSNGMLGGLLAFERQVITPANQLLGQMAIGLAMSFNAQHQLGMDMNNQVGQNFFTDFNQANLQSNRAVPNSSNTGTGNLTVLLSNVSQLQASDYKMTVTDAATNQITIVRQSDGVSTVLNWNSSPPAPPAGSVTLDGMTITVDNLANLVDQDHFTLTPTRGAAGILSLEIKDPRKIAFASPVRTEYSLSNTGTGSIKLNQVLNTTNVNTDYQIVFTSPTQYNIITSSTTTGPFTFTPNTDNTVDIPDSVTPSYSVIISGSPNAGDQFTSSYNSGGIADSTNGNLLGAIELAKLFEGGTAGLFDRYSGLISSVGAQTYQAKLGSDASDILYQQAVDFRNSKSAVSLDEEAANLLRFKEAYAAAGQLLTVANDMIKVLFNVLG